MVMNEAMKAELANMDKGYTDAGKADSLMDFKPGTQRVFISEYHFDKAKKGKSAGMPLLIMELKGAAKGNKAAFRDMIFTISNEDSRGGQFHREKLKRFMLGFGVKAFELKSLDQVLEPMVNKVFTAVIGYDKNDYMVVTPQGFVSDAKIETEAAAEGDAPF